MSEIFPQICFFCFFHLLDDIAGIFEVIMVESVMTSAAGTTVLIGTISWEASAEVKKKQQLKGVLAFRKKKVPVVASIEHVMQASENSISEFYI